MRKSLNDIKEPIEDELVRFQKHFREAMKSRVPLLDRITYYIVQSKGKQIRPMFVFLSAKLYGQPQESSLIAASMIELLHTGTLVHDDVVDDSYQRRGFFSINALWKNKIAVLVGDYLLSRGFLMALDNEEFILLKILSTAVKDMSEGELLQIEKARRLDIEEPIYFEIIQKKTASLIAAACSAGAFSVTRDMEIAEKMRLFGEKLGIAFQIKDDLFDYGETSIGKPTGIDIQEKKMTLPLIHVLSKASKADKKWIINTIKKHNKDKKRVQELISYVIENGGLDYAISYMNAYKNEALSLLDDIPDSDSKTAMIELVDFVVNRNK